MTTMIKKDAYGCDVPTVVRTPDLMIDREAAKAAGVTTRKFGYVRRALGIWPVLADGTEKNKYPVCLYTPAQAQAVAEAASRYDGNGRLLTK